MSPTWAGQWSSTSPANCRRKASYRVERGGVVGSYRWLIAFFILLAGSLAAAPLFPRDPEAEDSVALLRSWGVIEGYQDGQFRGDRAVSRWELAMMVARTLARLENKHLTLANKAQLEELNRLALAVREELDAMGVRVTALEEATERLDKRVAKLEQITFSGRSITYFGGQSFSNKGNSSSGFGPDALNYDLVGSLALANLLPHRPQGLPPVIDRVRGQPLTNGSAFASLLYLNTQIRPHEDWSAELILYAYTSQGDSLVDAFWGVTPPYLANGFTGTRFANAQSINHAPFTGAGLDRFTFSYEPASITVNLGTFRPRHMSTSIFLGQVNPIKRAPAVLESYGFQIAGDHAPFYWEVFGTKNPTGNPGTVGNPYRNEALGAALTYENDHGFKATLNFLHAADQAIDGGPLTVGQQARLQNVTGLYYTEWVNPAGFFVNQLGGIGSSRVGGQGSTGDVRPVPGAVGSDVLGETSTIGPQLIDLYGLEAEWSDDHWNVFGGYAHSVYRSNRNSSYSASGDLWNLGLTRRFLDGDLELTAEYRYTDPTYDPLILSFPDTVANGATGMAPLRAYWRLPDFDQFWHLYSLHDTNRFPHNREGFWLKGNWTYDDNGNEVRLFYNSLRQAKTSLQDVRVPAGALGLATPQVDVLGFSPGFFDPVFRGLSPMSFSDTLAPLENPRGQVNAFGADVFHQFAGTPWQVEAKFEQWRFERPTSLPAQLGGSQNRVDLQNTLGRLAVGYRFDSDVLVKLGMERATTTGHWDPAGTYTPYAILANTTNFKTRDTEQNIPFMTVDWNVNDSLSINSELFYYNTIDHVPSNIYTGSFGGFTGTKHPFSWSGVRYGTTVELAF